MNEITATGHSAVNPEAETPRKKIPFMTALRRHPRIAILATLVVLGLGYAVLRPRMARQYTSEAIVYVSPTFPKELADDREHDRVYEDFQQQQVAEVSQYDTLRNAIETYPSAWMRPGESEQEAVNRLSKALKVAEVGRSYLISIELTSPHPEHLADLVNKITSNYLEKARDDEFFGRKERLATLQADLAKQEELLQSKRAEQASLLHSVGMAHYDSKAVTNPYDEQTSKLRDELAEAHAKRVAADARLSQVHVSGGAIQLDEAGSAEVNSDPMLSSMRTQVGSQHAAMEAQEAGLTERSELRQKTQRDLKAIDAAMDKSIAEERDKKAREILGRYRLEATRAAALEDRLASDLRQATRQAVAGTPNLQQAQAVDDDMVRMQAEYDKIATRIHDLSLEGSSPGSVHLDTPAMQPMGPDASKKLLMYLLLTVFSLLSGLGAAMLAYFSEKNLYSAADVSRVLGISPIAALLNPSQFPEAIEQDFFLRLTGGIACAHQKSGARSFVFTTVGVQSPNALVSRLAKELSHSGMRTLVLQAPSEPGSDLTRRDAGLESSSEMKKLSELTESALAEFQGNPSLAKTTPIEILNMSPALVGNAIRDSAGKFDLVFIVGDSLLTSAATENLARTCDATVLVIKSGVSTKDQALRALKVLERVGVPGIAVVVSDVDKKHADPELSLSFSDYEAALSQA